MAQGAIAGATSLQSTHSHVVKASLSNKLMLGIIFEDDALSREKIL